MTDGVIKTQGTHLFLVDSVTTPETPAIVKMACPTGITGMGAGARTQIDSTCLDALVDQESMAGLGAPGTISVPFNFIPKAASHRGILTTLKDSGETLTWIVGFSDGTSVPTLDSDGDPEWPTQRTAARFQAYITEVVIDVNTNDRVVGTLTLQRSGPVTWNFKTA
ncbi:phage tail tube protein [Bordetella sp. 15P40C-2]|uniref:phage tail tube protein n=1 Tax=Bordetella sp. 15P40C-2 TaxID=2572246 RepID=UPI00132A4C4D|nr:phage tail tube protein [Bordetella sp. 15P40C-2]MVW72133.1 hypothetical protein [Bordetella sp. 15P40C-2]